MKEALLYQKLKNGAVRCHVCQRRCLILPGKSGFCQTRINKNGRLYTTIYGLVSSLANDPIEKKPVFHYQPGSLCLSLGTFGCNFRCRFCQNWEISYANGVKEAEYRKKLSPKEAVKTALSAGSAGIALTYNEPAIWLEYSLDVFKEAKRHGGLYTCWVTNGYATQEAIDKIAPYLDIYRVDLKSFEDRFYQKLIKVPKAAGVFKNTLYLKKAYPKIHIECVTNIIPGWNDNLDNLKAIAQWIYKNLGPKTPWHVTRFFPAAQMMETPPTPPETLTLAQKTGQEQGLEFVYIGNLATKEGENTYCPKCGQLAIRRFYYQTEILGVDKRGRCKNCGEDLNVTF